MNDAGLIQGKELVGKDAIRTLNNNFVVNPSGDAFLKGRIDANRIEANRICLGKVCIDNKDLQAIKTKTGVK